MNLLGLTHLCFRVEAADELAELAEANGGTFHRQTQTELPGSARTAARSSACTSPIRTARVSNAS